MSSIIRDIVGYAFIAYVVYLFFLLFMIRRQFYVIRAAEQKSSYKGYWREIFRIPTSLSDFTGTAPFTLLRADLERKKMKLDKSIWELYRKKMQYEMFFWASLLIGLILLAIFGYLYEQLTGISLAK